MVDFIEDFMAEGELLLVIIGVTRVTKFRRNTRKHLSNAGKCTISSPEPIDNLMHRG